MDLNDLFKGNLSPRKRSGVVMLIVGAIIAVSRDSVLSAVGTAQPLVRAAVHLGLVAGALLTIVGLYRLLTKDPPQ